MFVEARADTESRRRRTARTGVGCATCIQCDPHLVNGRLTRVRLDEDPSNRLMQGAIGWRMDTGEPFKVDDRDTWPRQQEDQT